MSDEKKPQENAKGGSRKKLIIIIAAIVALLAAGGGGSFFYMQKQKEAAAHAKQKKAKAAKDEDEEVAEGEETAEGEEVAEGEEEVSHDQEGAEVAEEEGGEEEGGEHDEDGGYLPLAPAFVVNFQPSANGQKPRAKFLSVEIEALPANPALGEKIKAHMPAVRNAVIMHLSRQKYETLITPEGKEKLRGEVLAEIQKALKKRIKKKGVTEIYFTSFVMQ